MKVSNEDLDFSCHLEKEEKEKNRQHALLKTIFVEIIKKPEYVKKKSIEPLEGTSQLQYL